LPKHLVDDLSDPQEPKHLEDRSHVAEGEVTGPIKHHATPSIAASMSDALPKERCEATGACRPHPGRLTRW